MPPELIFDPSQLDFNRVVADLEQIRKVNSQRFEMEQLTAIVHVDRTEHLIVGYKDVRADEFWVRGHLPGYPLMPGVLMCEAAAQLCSYYSVVQGLIAQGDFVGFGGLENVRFSVAEGEPRWRHESASRGAAGAPQRRRRHHGENAGDTGDGEST